MAAAGVGWVLAHRAFLGRRAGSRGGRRPLPRRGRPHAGWGMAFSSLRRRPGRCW
ncbi:hypothetical protein PCLA_19f0091 [Pseudomonas citronellolis]|nr:hypothetical protein PCLA_19f0091 [Pseudomonas citronellolis]